MATFCRCPAGVGPVAQGTYRHPCDAAGNGIAGPAQHISRSRGISFAPPGGQRPLVSNVSFRAQAGDGIGIIGPSGSGKTTRLARALTASGRCLRGRDAGWRAAQQYSPEALGRALAYLPQDVDLFEGTIADNIARFDPDRTDDTIRQGGQAGACARSHPEISARLRHLRGAWRHQPRPGHGSASCWRGRCMATRLCGAGRPYSNLDDRGGCGAQCGGGPLARRRQAQRVASSC